MSAKPLPINPWVADVILLYHESRNDGHLREAYKVFYKNDEPLSWQDFLVKFLLEMHLNLNPSLKKPLELLPLSGSAKDVLYWAGVDKVSDLLQITGEELEVICADFPKEKEEIEGFISGMGEELRRSPGRTSKFSLSRGYWTIPSPGASHSFNISRPSLREEWFSEYYRLYGHFFEEESHLALFERARPICLDGLLMPQDYTAFFRSAEKFFIYYAQCCEFCKLQPRVATSLLPTYDVVSVYRSCVKAVVDIFERTSLLKLTPVQDYLATQFDQERLDIAERENGFEGFRQLLYSHVDVKISIENVCISLQEALSGINTYEFVLLQNTPAEHPYADAIRRLRENVPDATLRAHYRLAVALHPGLSWEAFIVQAAGGGVFPAR